MIDARAGLSDAKRALLERRRRGRGGAGARIPRRDPARPAVLAPAQAAMWWIDRTAGGSPAYVIRERHRLHGALHPDALAAAVDDVLARHEVLRTCYPDVDGAPQVRIHERAPGAWAMHDLRGLPPGERDGAAARIADATAAAIDVTAGPLLRLTLARVAEDEHLLCLACHHLVCDEWSLELFWDEVSAAYAARRGGGGAARPAPALQYADYAAWEADRLEGTVVPAHQPFWTDTLAGAPAVSRPTPDGAGSGGRQAGIVEARVAAATARAVEALARSAGATPFAALVAAFALLVARSAGQDEVVIGTPLAGRARPELQDLVGLCLASVPLRIPIDGAAGFLDLARTAQRRIADALAHAELPFDRIAAAAGRRTPGEHPLFQVMFVHSQPAVRRLVLDGVRVTPGATTAGGAKFDLTAFVTDAGEGLALRLEYDRRRYQPTSVARLAERYDTLLAAVVADPGGPVGRLPLVGPEERRLLVDTWSHVPAEPPLDRTVLDPIRRAVHERGDRPAVIDAAGTLSWGALGSRADGLAAHLVDHGVGPGTVVGLCVERSADLVVGLLGILSAGAAYLPLDPTYPDERLAFMAADSGARLVVTTATAAGAVPAGLGRIDIPRYGSSAGDRAPRPGPSPDDLAYVIYTSGSTGQPKGVPVPHRQLLHSTAARQVVYEGAVDRFLLLSSVAFDSSVAGLFWTLTQGGTLCLPAPGEEQDVLAVAERIAAWRVTHTLTLPSVYRVLLAHAPAAALATLRCVIVAGEACPPALVHCHHDACPGAALYNEYGPTEATVWATVHRITAADGLGPVPIGRPVPYARVYVLDAHGAPAPVGAPGDIHVGGAGVVGAYLGRPELTAARFVPDPFVPDGRCYLTGDMGRWRADGRLEFLGRADRQVKLRGHRVELEEIEAALAAHPQVAEAAVTVAPGPEPDPDDVKGLLDALVALDPDVAARLLREVTHG